MKVINTSRQNIALMISDIIRLASIVDQRGHIDLADRLEFVVDNEAILTSIRGQGSSKEQLIRFAKTLPSGTNVYDLYDAVRRVGLPPHLNQMMGFSKNNTRMNTPLYQVPSKSFDQTFKTPGMVGALIEEPLPSWAISKLGLEEELPEQIIVNRNPGSPFNDIHEATHARGGELQNIGGKQNLDTVRGMVNYALNPGEIEARINEMIAFIYAKLGATFPQYMSRTTRKIFDRKTFWHPANAVQAIIWDEVKSAGSLEAALRNKNEIAEHTRQRFIDGPLGPILAGFSKKMPFGTIKMANLLGKLPWEISPEQAAHLTEQLDHKQSDDWLPKKIQEEFMQFESIPRKAETRGRFIRLAMRPFRPEDVKDPTAYDLLRQWTQDPYPILHIQPSHRGSTPLVVTPHTQLRNVENAHGWTKTVTPEDIDSTDQYQNDTLSDLIYKSTQGPNPGKLMTSKLTGGNIPIHEQAHVDFGDQFLSHHDTKNKLGVSNAADWIYWSISPGEIAAQIQQVLSAVKNAGYQTKTDDLDKNSETINIPKSWNGTELKYIQLKSGVDDPKVIKAVMDAANNIGWGPLFRASELVIRGPRQYSSDLVPNEIIEARRKQQNEYEQAIKILEDIISSVQISKSERHSLREINPAKLVNIVPESGRQQMQGISNRLVKNLSDENSRLDKHRQEYNGLYAEYRGILGGDYHNDPDDLPTLAIAQAVGRTANMIWGQYENEMKKRVNTDTPSFARLETEGQLVDRLYGLYYFASRMAFAIDTKQIEKAINEIIRREGFYQLPGENLEQTLPPAQVEKAKRHATYTLDPDDPDDFYFNHNLYEKTLVAFELGVPLSLINEMQTVVRDVNKFGMENAIGNIQNDILSEAPNEDLIISILPFLTGNLGQDERQFWMETHPDLLNKWRYDLPKQPVIEGSIQNTEKVIQEWDRRMKRPSN